MDNQRNSMDDKLNQPSQQAMRKIVRELPDDSLSLAWRAQLNAKLMEVQPVKTPWYVFSWRPMAAFGLASLLLGAMIVPKMLPSANGSLEESLGRFHQSILVEDGLGSMGIAANQPVTRADGESWQESDLDLL